MSWNPQPVVGGACWGGNVQLATKNQLLSSIHGLENDGKFSSIYVSSITNLYLSSVYATISSLHVDQAFLSSAFVDYGSFSSLSSVNANISTLYGSSITGNVGSFSSLQVSSLQVNTENVSTAFISTLIGNQGSISSLNVSSFYVNNEFANTINVSTINGNVGNFSTLNVSSLTANFKIISTANISTLIGNIGSFSTLNVSTLFAGWESVSTLNAQFANISSFSTQTASISSVVGRNANFDNLSTQFGEFSSIVVNEGEIAFTILSTLQFPLNWETPINPTFNVNLGLGEAIGGAIAGLGAAVGGVFIGLGTAIGGLTSGLASLIYGNPGTTITSNYFETINTTTQIQISTLGNAYPAYSTILREVSSLVPNAIPGREIFTSTIFYPNTTCIRSVSDPLSLAFSSVMMKGSTIQSYGQWVPIPVLDTIIPFLSCLTVSTGTLLAGNVSSLNISTGFINAGSISTIVEQANQGIFSSINVGNISAGVEIASRGLFSSIAVNNLSAGVEYVSQALFSSINAGNAFITALSTVNFTTTTFNTAVITTSTINVSTITADEGFFKYLRIRRDNVSANSNILEDVQTSFNYTSTLVGYVGTSNVSFTGIYNPTSNVIDSWNGYLLNAQPGMIKFSLLGGYSAPLAFDLSNATGGSLSLEYNDSNGLLQTPSITNTTKVRFSSFTTTGNYFVYTNPAPITPLSTPITRSTFTDYQTLQTSTNTQIRSQLPIIFSTPYVSIPAGRFSSINVSTLQVSSLQVSSILFSTAIGTVETVSSLRTHEVFLYTDVLTSTFTLSNVYANAGTNDIANVCSGTSPTAGLWWWTPTQSELNSWQFSTIDITNPNPGIYTTVAVFLTAGNNYNSNLYFNLVSAFNPQVSYWNENDASATVGAGSTQIQFQYLNLSGLHNNFKAVSPAPSNFTIYYTLTSNWSTAIDMVPNYYSTVLTTQHPIEITCSQRLPDTEHNKFTIHTPFSTIVSSIGYSNSYIINSSSNIFSDAVVGSWDRTLVVFSSGVGTINLSNNTSYSNVFDFWANFNTAGYIQLTYINSNGNIQFAPNMTKQKVYRMSNISGYSNPARYTLDSNTYLGKPFYNTYDKNDTTFQILQNVSTTVMRGIDYMNIYSEELSMSNVVSINGDTYPRLANNHLGKLQISTSLILYNGVTSNTLTGVPIVFTGTLSNMIYNTGAPDSDGTWLMDFNSLAIHATNNNVNTRVYGISDYYTYSTSVFTNKYYPINEYIVPMAGNGGGGMYYSVGEIPIVVNELRAQVNQNTFFSSVINGLKTPNGSNTANYPMLLLANSGTGGNMYVNNAQSNIYGSYYPFGVE